MSQLSKSERRKEQNRKAQAVHRQRKKQRLEYLEHQLTRLTDSTSSAASVNTPAGVEDSVSSHNPSSVLSCPEFSADNLQQSSAEGNTAFSAPNGLLPTPPDFGFLRPSDLALQSVSDTNFESRLFSEHEKAASNQLAQNLDIPIFNADIRLETQHRVTSPCAFDMLASHAQQLNISKESLVGSHGISIFFTPLSSLDCSGYPPDLRPTWAQMTYQHHPYIDCIPWPDLRSRIILAQNHRPPLIDSFDFWHDTLLGGITHESDSADGFPWKLSPFFKKKYRALLSYDLPTLQARTLGTNPPLRLVTPS